MKEIEIKYKLPDLKQSERYNVNNDRENERMQGIYALFVGDTLVYIGKSVNVRQRVRQHKYDTCRESPFTSFTFVGFEHITKGELLFYETIYIDYYKPSWNQQKAYRR